MVKDAIVDGLLVKGGGAIDNGSAMLLRNGHRFIPAAGFSPVVITYAPDWSCDSCRATGMGGGPLLERSSETGHHVFTERRPERFRA